MSALTKGISIQNFSRSNLMLTIVVCLVVMALFFIPEIIGFQRSFHSSSSTATRVETIPPRIEKREDAAIVGELSLPPASPLEEVTKLINFHSSVPAAPLSSVPAAQPQLKEGGTNVDPNLLAKCVATLSEPVEKKAERNLSQTPLTWEKIRAPESQEILRRAQGEALTISRVIPPQKKQSRYALITFANAINAVLSAPDQFASPEEAIGYVETVDQAVTKAIFREGIDRSDFMRWQKVSLGDELKTSRVARTKAHYSMPFNPQITLEYVTVRQLEVDPSTGAYLDFRGFVVGKDISHITVLKDGEEVINLAVSPPDQKTGRRYFARAYLSAKGVYTLVAVDAAGEKSAKSYEFFSRAVNYPKNSTSFFVTPYNAQVIGRTDPRLDRMYHVSGGRNSSGSSGDGFLTF